MKQRILLGVLACAVAMAAPVSGAEPPWSPVEVSVVDNGKGGWTFTNDHGIPFYIYDKDEKSKSNCDDKCTGLTWLPVWARSRSEPQGEWSIIVRPDASKQWAWKGIPIYSYNGDDDAADVAKKDGHWKPLVP